MTSWASTKGGKRGTFIVSWRRNYRAFETEIQRSMRKRKGTLDTLIQSIRVCINSPAYDNIRVRESESGFRCRADISFSNTVFANLRRTPHREPRIVKFFRFSSAVIPFLSGDAKLRREHRRRPQNTFRN